MKNRSMVAWASVQGWGDSDEGETGRKWICL